METLVLPGRKTGSFLRMGMSKMLGGFGSGSKGMNLYLLSRLTGKMRVSPDGNTHFARQENGQIFVNGGKQKAGWFRE